MAAFSHFAPFYSGVSAFLYLSFPNIYPLLGWQNFYCRDSDYASCLDQWITIVLKRFIKDFSVKTVVDFTISSLIKYIDDPFP